MHILKSTGVFLKLILWNKTEKTELTWNFCLFCSSVTHWSRLTGGCKDGATFCHFCLAPLLMNFLARVIFHCLAYWWCSILELPFILCHTYLWSLCWSKWTVLKRLYRLVNRNIVQQLLNTFVWGSDISGSSCWKISCVPMHKKSWSFRL